MKEITIKDVAKKAGVSVATVSRVIQGRSTVHADLKARVDRAMREMAFVPDPAAQAMRTQSTKIIACAIRNIAIPGFASFLEAAQRVIQSAGYTLLLSSTGDEPVQEEHLLHVLSRRKIDGLLMTKTFEGHPRLEAAFNALTIPVVLIDREATGKADSVVIDHGRGIKAAVDYLVSLGHRRIALLTGQPNVRPSRERVESFRRSLKAHRLPVEEGLISAHSFDGEDSFRDASLLLGQRKATAVIAGGMNLLPGLLRAAESLGLQVGRDISVVAGSDSDLAELHRPPITAVRWDASAWGRIAAELLIERLTSDVPKSGRQIVIPAELMIRASCVQLKN
jgi:LacI family transcriptional regulator